MGLITNLANQEADKIATEKIRGFSGVIIPTSKTGRVYAEFNELNGFNFLKFSIIGPFNIETTSGCAVTFFSDQGKVDIESDTEEILSDVSNTLDLALTEFEIGVEQELISFVLESKITEIEFVFSSAKVRFAVPDSGQLNKLITAMPGKT